MSKLRLAVVGCGFIGKHHLELARKQGSVELVAVADLDPRRAKETAAQFGVPTAHPDARTLLRDPNVDAVVLAMPTAGRAQLAIEALRAGKHVLIEKPAGMNAGEVAQMLAARGDRVVAACSSRYRFSPMARCVTDVITSGALGPIRLIRSRGIDAIGPLPKTPPPAWRTSRSVNGGGILVNWGTYDLDFVLAVTGWSLVPREVLAQTWHIAPRLSAHLAPGSDAECHAAAFIRCDGGSVIMLERGEYTAAQTESFVEIIGTSGSLRVTMFPVNGTWSVIYSDATPENGLVSKTLWTAGKDDSVLDGNPTEDFIAALRDRRPPMTGLEQALVITKITDAIFASAESGGCVSLAEGQK